MAKCPICYTEIGASGWTDDPLLTPNHFNPTLRGNVVLRDRHITELRTALNDYETSLGMTLTEWTPISPDLNISRIQYINEMREAVEGILNVLGIPLADWLSYDENDQPTLGISGWLDGSRLTKSTPVRGMHLEELRKHIKTFWENFQKTGIASITATGTSTGDTHNFTLQKNQLWHGNCTASVELLDHGIYWTSSSQASLAITDHVEGSDTATTVAYGGTFPYHVGTDPNQAFSSASNGLFALIPVVDNQTAFPCSKLVFNPQTNLNDTYHLFVKADCSVAVSATRSVSVGDLAYTIFGNGFPSQEEIDAWNNAPIVPNPYGTAKSEVILSISTIYFGGGVILQWIHGAYYGEAPTAGIPADLNNFDIDIAQAIIDVHHIDPTQFYVTQFGFGSGGGGTGNSWDIKAGDAAQPFLPGETRWFKPFTPSGSRSQGVASYTLDNINFYYKKV